MKRKRLILVVPMGILLLAATVIYLLKGGQGAETAARFDVVFNEIMSSNGGSVPDADGEYYDWIELKNIGEKAVDIGNYGLSDDLITGAKWTFPKGTVIKPGEFLMVWCSGKTDKGPMHTNFKLGADDELVLTSEGGAVLASLKIRGVAGGCTLSRQSDGSYKEMLPSPGYENDAAGVEAFLASLTAETHEDIGVYINEFMASNSSILPGPDGSYPDWIELYNTTGSAVDLSGYGLSDTPSRPLKYTFPEGTVIQPYGVLLVYCTGRNTTENGVIEVAFGLSSYEESIVFSTPKGHILDSVDYRRQERDISMMRYPDGTGDWQATNRPTPGYENTSKGAADYAASLPYGHQGLILSEVLNANKSYLQQSDGSNPDYIEIYNGTGDVINLEGYALSDNPNNPAKWVFPSCNLGAGQYLAVLATGTSQRDPSRVMSVNFGISGSGDAVFLFSPEGKILDKLSVGKGHADVSFGRTPDGMQTLYYTTPTPGMANGAGFAGYAEQPVFSVSAGMYTQDQVVSITVPEGAAVYYTTDGSDPTTSSYPYTGPLQLGSGSHVLRARSFQSGMLDSDITTASYLINKGETEVNNHRSTLPVVSLVSDPQNYFGGAYGIYVAGDTYYEKSKHRDSPTSYTIQHDQNSDYWKYANFNSQHITHPDPQGLSWERTTHVDYIGTDGTLLYQGDVMGRIFGAYSRYDKQKGIALVARSGYGDSSIDYPFFENRPYSSYKSLILRASAKDVIFTRMRDILIQGLAEERGSSLPTQSYVQVALYINGEYWGVYNLREKVNKYFLAQHYNISDPESIDMLVGNGNAPAAEISGHGYLEYQALVEYADTHDLSDPTNYAYVCSLMDVENYAEYCALEIYVGNTDTGNIKCWRSSLLDNKWRWIPYDFDWALNYDDGSAEITATSGWRRDFFSKYFHEKGHGAGKGFSTKLSRALLKNSTWRAIFLQKCALMVNIYESENMKAYIDRLAANIDGEMQYDTQKWGVLRYTTWQTRVKRLKESADQVPEYFLYYCQNYFKLSDADMVTIFGRRSSLTEVS